MDEDIVMVENTLLPISFKLFILSLFSRSDINLQWDTDLKRTQSFGKLNGRIFGVIVGKAGVRKKPYEKK